MKKYVQILMIITILICKAEIPEKALSLEDVIFLAKQSIDYKILHQKKLNMVRSADEKYYYYFPKFSLISTLPQITNYHVLTDSSYIEKSVTAGVQVTQNLFYNSILTAGLYGSEQLGNAGSTYKYLDISLSTDLYYKTKINQEYSFIKRRIDIERLELESSIATYQYLLVRKYFDLYRAISEHEIENKGYDLGLKHYNEGVSKFKAGIIPEVEMLDLELYLQKMELSLKRSKNTLLYVKEEFNRFVKYPNDYNVRIKYEQKEVVKYKTNYNDNLYMMFKSNPEYLHTKYNILDKEDALSEVYGSKAIKGQLSLSYFIDGADRGYDLSYDKDNSKTVFSFGLSMPLFDGGDLRN
ncbi:MAG: TolC family protein, partial [Candidatus Delongbacteria bacterium]|nr:TolC family protein [Candidatus Delongbacteria bacterium]